MTVEEALQVCPDAMCCAFFTGVFLILLPFLYFALLDFFVTVFYDRKVAARCLGFHNHEMIDVRDGVIRGTCYQRHCPYSRQCIYWAPKPSLLSRIVYFFRRIIKFPAGK